MSAANGALGASQMGTVESVVHRKSVSDRRQKAEKKRVSNRNSGLCQPALICGLMPVARVKSVIKN